VKEEKVLKKREEEKQRQERLEQQARKKLEQDEERRKKEEERRVAEEKKKEEKREKEEQKRKEQEAKEKEDREQQEREQEKELKKVAPLTNFFAVVAKPVREAGSNVAPIQNELEEDRPISIWKTSLGTIPRFSQWSTARSNDFEENWSKFVVLQRTPLSLDNLKRSFISDMKSVSEDVVKNELDRGKKRYVILKYEDYKGDWYEYKGVLKKESKIITPKTWNQKDTEIIDYDLSSDEELENEEYDEVDSDKDDKEEEDSKDEDEDQFVVPDNYLSEEEGESFNGEEKRRLAVTQRPTSRARLKSPTRSLSGSSTTSPSTPRARISPTMTWPRSSPSFLSAMERVSRWPCTARSRIKTSMTK
jgi:hypothetical protein